MDHPAPPPPPDPDDPSLAGALHAAFGRSGPAPDPTSSSDDAVGPRYVLREEIGRGGVGVVHRAWDRNLDRDVALKVLGEAHARNPGLLARFQAEARIGGRLQHPGIVPVYELCAGEDGRPFIAMKLVEGRTLGALLPELRATPEGRARLLRLFAQVCETLAYAHARGVVHRDLKPANVMVGEFGEVQVVDWGLAKMLEEGGEPASDLAATQSPVPSAWAPALHSQVGSVFGTPAYMAPEQARGEVDRVDRRSDVFALGATLCELLTGVPPYLGSTQEVLEASRVARMDPALERLQRCEAERDLQDLVRACLAEDPDARPAHAGVVATAVEAHLDGVEERRRRAGLEAAEARGRAVQERRLRQRTVALAAAVLVAVLGTGGVLTWRHLEQERQADDLAAQVGPVLAEVRSLEAQAGTATSPLSWWEQASERADQAWALLASGPARTVLREEVDQIRRRVVTARDAAREVAAREERDRVLVERCNRLISRWGVDSWEVSDQGFREVFLEHGLDVDAMTREELLAAVDGRPRTREIAEALFAWVRVWAYLEQGRPEERERWFEKVLWVIQRSDPDPQMQEIRRVTLNGDVAPLIALADRFEGEEPDDRAVLYLGVLLNDLGAPERALRHFQHHLPRFPQNDGMHLMLGTFLMEQDRAEEALPVLHASLALEPGVERVWVLLGQAYSALGDWSRSVQYAEGALQRLPDHAPALLLLARGLRRDGREEESRRHWDRLWSLASDQPEVQLHRAERLGWDGEDQAATQQLQKVLLGGTRDPDLLVDCCRMLADHGAEEWALNGLAQLRGFGFLTRREAVLLAEHGRLEDATEQFRNQLRQGEDPFARAWLDEVRARLLLEDDVPEEPDPSWSALDLARAARLWEAGDEHARAARFWVAALDQDPEAGELPGSSARLAATRCALQAAHQGEEDAELWAGQAVAWCEQERERRVLRPHPRTAWWRPEPLTRWLRDPVLTEHLPREAREELLQAALASPD